MMKPSWVLQLTAQRFGSTTVCHGHHVATILNAIEEVLPGLVWYGADIEGSGQQLVPARDPTPVRLGSFRSLRERLCSVEQFDSAVFAGVPGECAQPVFRDGGLWTEDDDDADIGSAIVEVRAFDWSYLLVASASEELRKELKTRSFVAN